MKYNYLKGYDMIPEKQDLLMWGFLIDDLILRGEGWCRKGGWND